MLPVDDLNGASSAMAIPSFNMVVELWADLVGTPEKKPLGDEQTASLEPKRRHQTAGSALIKCAAIWSC